MHRDRPGEPDPHELGEYRGPVDHPLAGLHHRTPHRAVPVLLFALHEHVLGRHNRQILRDHPRGHGELLALHPQMPGVDERADVARVEAAQQMHQHTGVEPQAAVGVGVVANADVVLLAQLLPPFQGLASLVHFLPVLLRGRVELEVPQLEQAHVGLVHRPQQRLDPGPVGQQQIGVARDHRNRESVLDEDLGRLGQGRARVVRVHRVPGPHGQVVPLHAEVVGQLHQLGDALLLQHLRKDHQFHPSAPRLRFSVPLSTFANTLSIK